METGIARRGLMLVLWAPSGAGKTTLARRLRDEEPDIVMSISHTTRPKRKGEKDGEDYHFIDRDRFTRMRDHGEFLEWAVVFDNYYGTPREPVERALAEGRDVLFDVDWQGARKLRESAKDGVAARYPRCRALARLAAHRAQGLRAEPLGRALAPASVAVLSKSRHAGVSR